MGRGQPARQPVRAIARCLLSIRTPELAALFVPRDLLIAGDDHEIATSDGSPSEDERDEEPPESAAQSDPEGLAAAVAGAKPFLGFRLGRVLDGSVPQSPEAVARLGSFSGAANELFVSQPAVSKKIRLLQEQVGLALLEQVGKRWWRARGIAVVAHHDPADSPWCRGR